jgi:methyl-accepting chemotaxis protein
MQDSREAVETGMEETAHARKSLEAIIESSQQVEHQIHLIATAATEQTSASGEISESAGQISQLAVENAQGAEEAVEALKKPGLAGQRPGRHDPPVLLLLMCQSPACADEENAARDKAEAELQAALKSYEPTISYPGERETYERFTAAFARYRDAADRSKAFLRAGKTGDALDALTSDAAKSAYADTAAALTEDVALNVKFGLQSSVNVTNGASRATWINVLATVVIVLLCVFVGSSLTREIAPRVLHAVAAMERLAAKDLSLNIPVTGSDELGHLGVAFNTYIASMREVMRSVAQGAETLSAATTEISARAVQNAGNAHTQSSKTNQIAAAAQEMTATIGEISHNAESAAVASRSSAEVADEGGAVMQAAAATMEKIAHATGSVSEKMNSLAQRSEEIGKVVSVIQEISEQTNLLALNAAIEAARAGEHMSAVKYDLIVIGSGPSGQRAAVAAVQDEQARGRGRGPLTVVGGVCVNTGTIPFQDHARGRAAPLRLQLPLHLRHQLPGQGKDHHGRPGLSRPGGHQDRSGRHRGAALAQRHRRGPWHRQLRRSHPGARRGPADRHHPEADRIIIAVGTKPACSPKVPINGRTIVNSDQILDLPELPAR